MIFFSGGWWNLRWRGDPDPSDHRPSKSVEGVFGVWDFGKEMNAGTFTEKHRSVSFERFLLYHNPTKAGRGYFGNDQAEA